jgi:hypothetical protein
MQHDLTQLFLNDPAGLAALDTFIGQQLTDGEVWASPRVSDGIRRMRQIERGPERLQLCGWLFTIDQREHAFWVEIERNGDGDEVYWNLYFEAREPSPRRARNVIDLHDRPEAIAWDVMLAGDGELRHGSLWVEPK